MNLIKYACLAILACLILSCSKEAVISEPADETTGLTLVKSFNNNAHTIFLYTENGKLQTGYNKIYLQIKSADGKFVSDAVVKWSPVMKMTSMTHACPFSTIKKTINTETLYEGYMVFQMAGNSMENWELTVDYSIGTSNYSAKTTIDVSENSKKTVVVFKGTDNVKYVLAFVSPTLPKVALNDMEVKVYKMQDMMSFPVVNNFTVKIDPRMPGMGNHGSPIM